MKIFTDGAVEIETGALLEPCCSSLHNHGLPFGMASPSPRQRGVGMQVAFRKRLHRTIAEPDSKTAGNCENLFAQDFGGRRHDGATAFSQDGEQVSSHFFGQSSFAASSNVVEESVIRIDEDIPLDIVAPLGCGIQTGAGAVLNELRTTPGASLVGIGTGAVGGGAVMEGGIAGCAHTIAADIHDSRLELALELGATDTINTQRQNLTEEILRIIGGSGADFIIDTTARPEVLRQAADALGIRGTLALVGAAAPSTEATFEIGESLVKGWTFKTIVQGSSIPQVFIPKLIALWKQGRFPFDKLITPYPFDKINDGFRDSTSGKTTKPVVVH